jgi:hypothetical protein
VVGNDRAFSRGVLAAHVEREPLDGLAIALDWNRCFVSGVRPIDIEASFYVR